MRLEWPRPTRRRCELRFSPRITLPHTAQGVPSGWHSLVPAHNHTHAIYRKARHHQSDHWKARYEMQDHDSTARKARLKGWHDVCVCAFRAFCSSHPWKALEAQVDVAPRNRTLSHGHGQSFCHAASAPGRSKRVRCVQAATAPSESPSSIMCGVAPTPAGAGARVCVRKRGTLSEPDAMRCLLSRLPCVRASACTEYPILCACAPAF